jgi:DNA polymerase III subunit gamma/tau
MLDLKYRPRRFSEVVGNQGIVKALLARSRAGTLHGRSMMFGGPKGCGKTSLARIVARAASCTSPQDGEPCNECGVCVGFLNESSSGYEEFDAASHGSVDRIRTMVDDLEYGTVDGIRLVLVLDEAHRLGPAAQDAMLKAMEERRMTAILCTTDPGKIRPAVRDRVEEYPVRPPPEAEIVSLMASICSSESIEHEPGVLLEIARSCLNSPRACLNSVNTLSTTGGLTVASVRELFRYSQVEAVAGVLRDFDKDPPGALACLDPIMSSESPSWVCETIIKLVSSAVRVSVGAPPRSGFPTWFYGSRPPASWASLASALASVAKPSACDVELALVSTSPGVSFTVVLTPASPVATPSVQPAPASVSPFTPPPVREAPPPKPHVPPQTPAPAGSTRTVSVDGVTFSSDEHLTTLDDKMEPSRGPAPVEAPNSGIKVEFDGSRTPMSEQEFSRAFLERIGKG